jgi:hypothetical protein
MSGDVHESSGSLSGDSSLSVGPVGQRSYLSSHFLGAAKRFASEAAAIEQAHPQAWDEEHIDPHRDLVVSVVMNACAFFEAMINELYADAAEEHGIADDGYLAPLQKGTVDRMAVYWSEINDGRDGSTLAKYRLACLFADVEPISKGGQLHENAQLLIRLRNMLIHYKPQTLYSGSETDLEKSLSTRFRTNGLLPVGYGGPWWPSAALGAGCAEWAVGSAESYADDFSKRIAIEPNYWRLRSRT